MRMIEGMRLSYGAVSVEPVWWAAWSVCGGSLSGGGLDWAVGAPAPGEGGLPV